HLVASHLGAPSPWRYVAERQCAALPCPQGRRRLSAHHSEAPRRPVHKPIRWQAPRSFGQAEFLLQPQGLGRATPTERHDRRRAPPISPSPRRVSPPLAL